MRYHGNPTENAILRKVENGLEMAVRDLDLQWNEDWRVKRQKFGLIAVEAFTDDDEHPITYSWYQYGGSMIAAPPSQEASPNQYTLRSPGAEDTNLYSAGPEEFSHFFKEELDRFPLSDYWEMEFLRFLEEYYREYAPDEYRVIYLSNIRIRQLFDRVTEKLARPQTGTTIDEYEEFGREFAKIQMELAGNDDFRNILKDIQGDEEGVALADEVLEDFILFSDLVEDAVMILDGETCDGVNISDRQAITDLKSLYKEHVWRMVASVISAGTARGPNAEKPRSWAIRNFREELDVFPEELRETSEMLGDKGLLPSMSDYPSHDDELDGKINELMTPTED